MGLVTACLFLESCGVHGQGLWKSVCDCRFAKSFGKNCKSSGLDLLPQTHSMRGKKSIVCVCVCRWYLYVDVAKSVSVRSQEKGT